MVQRRRIPIETSPIQRSNILASTCSWPFFHLFLHLIHIEEALGPILWLHVTWLRLCVSASLCVCIWSYFYPRGIPSLSIICFDMSAMISKFHNTNPKFQYDICFHKVGEPSLWFWNRNLDHARPFRVWLCDYVHAWLLIIIEGNKTFAFDAESNQMLCLIYAM